MNARQLIPRREDSPTGSISVKCIVPLAALLAACQAAPAVHLAVGDTLPSAVAVPDTAALLFVSTLEDCFSCRIQGGFVALRSVQRSLAPEVAPSLTALLVAKVPSDTLQFAETLRGERLHARIVTMTPGQAKRVLNPAKIPAIYLIKKGRVIGVWESGQDVVIEMGRNAIVDEIGKMPESSQ